MGRSALEASILRGHEAARDPHPQYLLRDEYQAGGTATSPATSEPAGETIAAAGRVGTATRYAREDHRHAMPGYASSASGGFMSAADKVKLDALPAASAQDARFLRIDDAAVVDVATGTVVIDVDELEQVIDGDIV